MRVTTEPARDAIISVRGVSASYSGRSVLRHVDLDVYRGEVVALLGGSGSGKTTLLKHVLAVSKPDRGSVVINDVDVTSCSPSALIAARRQIGVAFRRAPACVRRGDFVDRL